MSDLEKRFERAQEEVTHLPERPDNNTLLELYALYKQATDGDIAGDRPSGFDLVGAAKYDARAELKGMEPDAAMAAYIALVEKLKAF
ncbi:MAG: acyl-CoA-binding protein [Acidobacteria bacterium CG_4_9_14_3_um_filter_49_7]|nr:MAG: acyl-CoA-binding protein [Acidobacteria bacterium CG_4_9_14_3_um_filter_49_7]